MTAVPPSFAIADLYEGVCDAMPDAEALVIGAAGEIVSRLTFSQLDERANRVGNGLLRRRAWSPATVSASTCATTPSTSR